VRRSSRSSPTPAASSALSASARCRLWDAATQGGTTLKLVALIISVPLILEWTFAPFNLWSGRTLENFVRFTGFQPRVATRLLAPVKLAVAALLIAGLAVPALSIAGAAGTVLLSIAYLARLLAPTRRDAAGLVGFTIFGLLGVALLVVRLVSFSL
jgi:hypothetical protein